MKTRIILALLGAVTIAAPLVSPVAFAQKRNIDPENLTPVDTTTEDPATTYKQSWKGVATLRTLKKVDNKRSLVAAYPVFSGSRRVAQVAGLVLKNDATKVYNASLKNSGETRLSDGIKYEFEFNPRLVLNRPRLISARTMHYEFAGGVHGMYASSGYVFGYPKGTTKPRKLQLADFFTNGVAARKRVNNLLMAKLRATKGSGQPEATWVIEGEVKSVTNTQMENFVAEGDGLRWIFPPYDMGPYVAGELEVKLTSRELGPTFRATMLR